MMNSACGRRSSTPSASQHLQVISTNYEVAGQLFLGADMSTTGWSVDNRGDAWARRTPRLE